jgi:hypothetical protein
MEVSNLERFVVEYERAGIEWCEAKLKADLLDEDAKPFLDSLKNALDDGETSEAKLSRLAQGSREYRDFIRGMVLAKADMLKKRVRYDGLQMLFEARRSNLSFEKEKFRFLPHTP